MVLGCYGHRAADLKYPGAEEVEEMMNKCPYIKKTKGAFKINLKLPKGVYMVGITTKASDKIRKPKGNLVEGIICPR